MVRPFAVIGLSYSAALTAAFFMGGIPLWIPALLFFILASAAAAIPCIRKKVYPPVIMLSAATAFVTLMIFNAAFVSNTDIRFIAFKMITNINIFNDSAKNVLFYFHLADFERHFGFNNRFSACHGVGERNSSSMKHEPFGRRAVQIVTDDGASQSKLMGCMNAQLVCAACLGIKIHKRAATRPGDN